jgi:soluble lytic murein transglycosylase
MTDYLNIKRADRGAPPALSSASTWFILAGLIASAGGAIPSANAQLVQSAVAMPMAAQPRSGDAISSAIYEWRTLSQSDSFAFSSYARFLLDHPGFPDATVMRRNAEKMLRPGQESQDQVITFFRKYPATTPAGNLRFAEALLARGLNDEARAAARAAWVGGALSPDDENRMFTGFASAIQSGDHDLRMDRLLWDRAAPEATRQLSLVSPAKRAIFEARLAMITKAPDASAKAGAVFEMARNDAGYLANRNWWLRNTGQLPAARNLLAAPRTLTAPPVDPDKWLETLLVTAKGASNDSQHATVFNIARQISDTYPPGSIVSDRPFSERNTYTDLAWLGGQAALTKLGRAQDAVQLFVLYAGAAKSAQTRAKGLYWAGRAAQAAGQQALATSYYENAGQYFDQFHGQLALERLGRRIVPPASQRTVEVSGAARDAFERSSLVQAVRLLGSQGQWLDQTKFVRAIANSANTDLEAVLATELAQKINRPDMAVMIGRNARTNGLGDYLRSAFPQVAIPPDVSPSWTMIHAITRQESQFDRQIVSRAGARGLMQLMPGTARETAPRAGLSYNIASLYEPTYNIRLGSTYFGQLMDQYGGSYVLSVAAYNAGPGNVNRWISANGDPRTPGTDVIAWIERIPLSETRNYVMRVLENAVVYDLINPTRANIRSATPLSAYLGKSQPG